MGDMRTIVLKSLEASAFVHLGILNLTARSLGICRRPHRKATWKDGGWVIPESPAELRLSAPAAAWLQSRWETLSGASRRAFYPDESTHRRPGSYMRISNCDWGLLWWLRGQRTRLPVETRFEPWVRKIPSWRRKWQPTSVVLPGKSHGQRSLVGYSPWGRKRVGYNLATRQQQQLGCCKLLRFRVIRCEASHCNRVSL